jgi:hypothetical protein
MTSGNSFKRKIGLISANLDTNVTFVMEAGAAINRRGKYELNKDGD